MKTNLRLSLLGTVVWVASGPVYLAPVATCAADASGCVPELSQEPASGKWRGEFVFDYKMKVPDTPAAFSLAWHGAIAMQLVKEPDEPPRSGSCAGGNAGGAPNFAAPPPAGCNVDGTPVLRLARDDDKLPALPGATDVTMAMSMTMVEAGLDLQQNAATKKAASLSTAPEQDREGKKLAAVALLGRPEQFQFGGSFVARDDAGVTSGQLDAVGGRGGSVRADVAGELTGVANGDLQNGQLDSHVDVVDSNGQRHTADSSAQVGTVSQQRRALFRLVVDKKECGKIGGTVESAELLNEMRNGGMTFVPVRSEWQATLDERDEELERSADRYAKEPLPAINASDTAGAWASWQREWSQYSALRGTDPSDYRLCVLQPAHEKVIDATVRALRALLDGTAKGDAAAKPRIWRLMSVLEGFGRETYVECAVVREAFERLFGAPLPKEAPR